MESHSCAICLEEFDNRIQSRRRACLNCCQHQLCRGCVTGLLSNPHVGNNNNRQGGKCPVCAKNFRRYWIFDPRTFQMYESWKSASFYQHLQQSFLAEMFRGFFFEHRVMGFDTADAEALQSPGRGTATQKNRLIRSIETRLQTCSKTGHWVESIADLVEALEFFFPVPTTRTGQSEPEKELSKVLKMIFVDPVEEEAKRQKEQDSKREHLRLLALEKQKKELEKQHEKIRKEKVCKKAAVKRR